MGRVVVVVVVVIVEEEVVVVMVEEEVGVGVGVGAGGWPGAEGAHLVHVLEQLEPVRVVAVDHRRVQPLRQRARRLLARGRNPRHRRALLVHLREIRLRLRPRDVPAGRR